LKAYHSEAGGKDFGHSPAFVRKTKMKAPDPRAQHTRSALLQAFRDLLLQGGPLDDIRVGDVAARAGVGRSTLYEHFAGVDGLLAGSIAGPYSVLVETLSPGDNAPDLQRLLDHFWERRALARSLFSGAVRRRSVAVLVTLIEAKLKAQCRAHRGQLILPPRLAAVQLSEIMLAPIIAWLAGESRCTSQVLASAVSSVAKAALRTMVRPATKKGLA
jgi:AcrR family transcriptional regulator